MRSSGVVLVTVWLGACGGVPPRPTPAPRLAAPSVSASASAAPESTRERPPEAGPMPAEPFPEVRRERLPNGLELALVQNHSLPIVQVRLVFDSGSARDGTKPGLARLTANMLKDGGAGTMTSRELLDRVETLGTELELKTAADDTVLSMGVTATHLEEALGLLSTVVRAPRWDAGEYRKLVEREVGRVTDLARSSGGWLAQMALYRTLYRARGGTHPYAAPDATAADFRRIALLDCREFYRQQFVPKNARLVLAGDLDPDGARASVTRVLGGWHGPDAPRSADAETLPIEQLKLVLVDRPKSTQSDVLLGALGPVRKDPSWTALAVANQVLGGGVSGRLFLEVREQQSLAYSTNSSLGELGHGPVPLTLYAGTQTSKTGVAVRALLDEVARMREPPSPKELTMARRYLIDVFAVRMATIGNVADMVVNLDVLGLPPDYYDRYRRELGAVTAAELVPVAERYYRPVHAVVAVAGDAERLGPVLSHFGEVTVLDPARDFQASRVLQPNPQAPLELERPPLQ